MSVEKKKASTPRRVKREGPIFVGEGERSGRRQIANIPCNASG